MSERSDTSCLPTTERHHVSFGTCFYARFDNVSSDEWDDLEGVRDAEDLARLDQFWSKDPGYSEEEKHSEFRAIVDGESCCPGSLRNWVIRLRALILLVEVSPRVVAAYLQSEAGEQFAMSLSDLRLDVYGDSMSGEVGRRTTQLLDSHVLDIRLDELNAGDTRNVGEVLHEVEMLGDDFEKAVLMQGVRVTVEGASPVCSELKARVATFCKNAADVYTWLYLLDFQSPGAIEIIGEFREEHVPGRVDEEDDDIARAPSQTDRVERVIERALIDEYDEYAARYGLGLERWEDWCQEASSFLRQLQLDQ